VCGGTACFAASAGRHLTEVEDALGIGRGECARDGSVSLEEVRCLGYCYGGPAALDGGRPCAGSDVAVQLRGGVELRDPSIPVRSEVARPVVLAGILGDAEPWQAWTSVARMPDGAAHVLEAVEHSGLRGRGGAGFPVSAKWRSALAHPRPRVMIANGDEGDPGSFADRLLLERDPARVIEGLRLAALACGADRGLIYVRSEYPTARASVRAALAEARATGLIGSEVGFELEVVSGHGSYVAGEETGLIHALEGLRGSVKARPPYPTEQGWLGYPTVVNNIETLAAVPWILTHGGAAYAEHGLGEEPGTKLISLSERFARPGVVEVEIGISLRHVVEELGGGLRDGSRLSAVQVGGPLGGIIGADSLDVPLSSRALAAAGAALGHGGVVALDERIGAAELVKHLWAFAAAESCGACSPCRVGTRRGLALAELVVRGQDGGEHRALGDVMATASMCAFGRAVPAAVRSALRAYGIEEVDVAD
jgi:NADH:ubiquinone oxidoreductase subunit F (NADH-binding)